MISRACGNPEAVAVSTEALKKKKSGGINTEGAAVNLVRKCCIAVIERHSQ